MLGYNFVITFQIYKVGSLQQCFFKTCIYPTDSSDPVSPLIHVRYFIFTFPTFPHLFHLPILPILSFHRSDLMTEHAQRGDFHPPVCADSPSWHRNHLAIAPLDVRSGPYNGFRDVTSGGALLRPVCALPGVHSGLHLQAPVRHFL